MTDYLDPAYNFTPRQNPPKQMVPDLKPIELPELQDADAIAKYATDKLVRIMALLPDTDKALPVIREVLDRVKGKPNQSVTLTEKKTIQLVIELGGQANEILTIDNDANELRDTANDIA